MSLFKYFVVLTALAWPLSMAQAATTGSLIKGSQSSVYYFSQDGKRYAFPNERTYMTWYPDFSGVQTISDSELASYQLGGNVTYRPGTRLIKVTTDPKVYAVGHGGQLRWIETEAMANSIFGSLWSQQVDDLPDTFFINYTVGAPIATSTDFNVTNEFNSAPTIQAELTARTAITPPTSTTPTPTSTQPTTTPPIAPSHTVALTPSTLTPRINEHLQLQAYAQPSGTVSEVKLFFNGRLVANCSYSPCSTDVTVAQTYASSVTAVAVAHWITNETVTVTSTLMIEPGVPGVTLTVKPQVRPGQPRDAFVTIDQSIIAHYINIYLDGGVVRGCTDTQECRYTATETGAVGTNHQVYARVENSGGTQFTTETKTMVVVENEAPTITMATAKSFIYRGETIDVTINASDDDGVATTQVLWNGQVIKQCPSSTCTATIGPINNSGYAQFTGSATDTRGNMATATSTAVQVY